MDNIENHICFDIGENKIKIANVLSDLISEYVGCLLCVSVEDIKIVSMAARSKRFFLGKVPSLGNLDNAIYNQNSVYLYDLPGADKHSLRIIYELLISGTMFAIIFGANKMRYVDIDWSSVYIGHTEKIKYCLEPGEIGLFRTNLTNQDKICMFSVKKIFIP